MTNMVLIKAGSFLRQHQTVTLTHDFWLGKYEVTQGEYTALMGNNPQPFPVAIELSGREGQPPPGHA